TVEGETHDVEIGSSLYQILEGLPERPIEPIAAIVNGNMQELSYRIYSDSRIVWQDYTTASGNRLYKRSAVFVLMMAAAKLFPQHKLKVSHSLDNGSYCFLQGPEKIGAEDVAALEAEMRRLVALDLPITNSLLSKEDAVGFFRSQGKEQKAELLTRRASSTIRLYTCQGLSEYLFGHMAPRTGLLRNFELISFDEGFVLRLPTQKDVGFLHESFQEPRRLQAILKESRRWVEKLGVDKITDLNRLVEKGKMTELILINETLHARELCRISDGVFSRFPKTRLVLVAGPSSSGKTTFTQRLAIHFRALGLRPVTISLDDYFLDRDRTPLDPQGEKDYESLYALDLKLFNQQLKSLMKGKEVRLPRYDFVTGKRSGLAAPCRLEDDQLIIVEGIHAINEGLTSGIAEENKCKIYISALTQINFDDYTPIASSDNRLLRRMVRDMQFRAASPEQTIMRWGSVRRGEFINIFPYQEQADYFFNSALSYELSVLRPLIEGPLARIGVDSPAFAEAKRLRHLLEYFEPTEPHCIPLDSILQEFLGKSCFFT
ncbi:MAG: nucleoside kinase, partial [Clostridiales bacterium]|nr:nucleoside kinase [Clostridiales bacterium]